MESVPCLGCRFGIYISDDDYYDKYCKLDNAYHHVFDSCNLGAQHERIKNEDLELV